MGIERLRLFGKCGWFWGMGSRKWKFVRGCYCIVKNGVWEILVGLRKLYGYSRNWCSGCCEVVFFWFGFRSGLLVSWVV